MFPLHDDIQRLHGRPYVTYLLIATNAIVFLAEVIITQNFENENAVRELLYNYGAVPSQVLAGNIPSVITSMFLHGGIWHLIGNMIFLFVFGDNIEDKFGRIKYVLIYLGWGIVAAYAHSFFVPAADLNTPAIGASGAVSGVLGAYLVLYPRARIFTIITAFFITTVRIPAIFYLGFWFVMQIIFSASSSDSQGGVAYVAHIGGFLAGLLTGYLVKNLITGSILPAPQIRYPRKDQNIANMPDMTIHTQPEVIKGPNFYEIIAEMPGVASQSEIQASYDPNNQSVRVYTTGSRKYDTNIRISDIGDETLKIEQIRYLNGIVRIRISKQ